MGARENLFSGSVAFLAITAVTTGLRAGVRLWKKTIGYDDYVLIISFVSCEFYLEKQ